MFLYVFVVGSYQRSCFFRHLEESKEKDMVFNADSNKKKVIGKEGREVAFLKGRLGIMFFCLRLLQHIFGKLLLGFSKQVTQLLGLCSRRQTL